MLRISAVGLAMVALLGMCSAMQDPSLDEAWRQWKTTYSKVYKDAEEEKERRSIWESNLKIIKKHNKEADAGLQTYQMGLNQFSDMTAEEFASINWGITPVRLQD